MAGNSESVRKSEQTKKEKYGPDYHARIGASGGRKRTRGYFGTLKDQGKTDELKRLAKEGSQKSNKIQAAKRAEAEGDGKAGSKARGTNRKHVLGGQ
jgi:hypothetical protein